MTMTSQTVASLLLAFCFCGSMSAQGTDCSTSTNPEVCGAMTDHGDFYLGMLQKNAHSRIYSETHDKKVPKIQVQYQMERSEAQEAEQQNPKPRFTFTTMPKVSATMQCVVNLAMQYFFIYATRAILSTINQFTGFGHLGVLKILETACTTVTYAPMLSMLFLGAHMRANQLTQGYTELYSLPQPWVQNLMYMCSYAVLLQVILVLVIPCCTGEWNVSTDNEGNLDLSKTEVAGTVGTALTVIRYVIMAMFYVGFILVCVGIIMMDPPVAIWGTSPPGVSPAVQCTMIMTMLFFFVYGMVAVTKSCTQLLGTSPFLEKLEGTLTLAKYTVNLAPMLCVLFLAARMRAMQIDPMKGSPQTWAQACFYMCTLSIAVQLVMIIPMPFLINCKCERGATEGDVTFTIDTAGMPEMIGSGVETAMTVLRYAALFSTYVGFTLVVISVLVIQNETDPSLTPAISPAMQSVIILNVCYLGIYLGLFVCITIKQFTTHLGGAAASFHEHLQLTKLIAIFDGVQKIVMFAPMMCALFIGTRIRSLQLARAIDGSVPSNAGPPSWVQSMMFLSTFCVVVQLILAALIPIVLGTSVPEVDEHAQIKTPEGTGKWTAGFLEAVKYACMLGMYGGTIGVIIGVYRMRPETVQPYGG